jgi:hypothetical protein
MSVADQIRSLLITECEMDPARPEDRLDKVAASMAADWTTMSAEQKKVGGDLTSFVRAAWVVHWVKTA